MARQCDYAIKKCEACENEFKPPSGRSRYCSEACRRGKAVCLVCRREFQRGAGTTGLYCSKACWYRAPGKKVLESRPCLVCGKAFQPRDASRRCCSAQCAHQSRRKERKLVCDQCGQAIPKEGRRNKRFCSRRCASLGNHTQTKGRKQYEVGTRIVLPGGYVKIKIPGYVLAGKKDWVLEHHYAMEQLLGRPIAAYEIVHHKNGDRTDNRPENLELWFKRHPPGQRVDELLDFVCEHYAADLKRRLQE